MLRFYIGGLCDKEGVLKHKTIYIYIFTEGRGEAEAEVRYENDK